MVTATPATPSGDHAVMLDYWTMVDTILGGAKAMREARTITLPKFANETVAAYAFRADNAKFTNIYRDIVENLAQRPFAKEVAIAEGAPQEITDFIEDVDGQGNHLHVFAGEVFFAGINAAIDWVLVDFTAQVPVNATRATEASIGARPYWVRVPARDMIAVYSDMIDGREEIIHARIREPVLVRDGFGERTIERVRVFDRAPLDGGGYAAATWELFEETKVEGPAAIGAPQTTWESVGAGSISIGVIPLVPFIAGRRIASSWRLHPPMQDAAYLQIEHYQQESALKHIKALTAFPMLAGNGVTPPKDAAGRILAVPVGPQAVLYAPPNGDSPPGSWTFIEPGAESLRFLADDIKATAQELRELGRQPLTAQSGNLTVVTTAFAAQKGNAAIQAWALNLKDALERAFVLTARWLRIAFEAEVKIDTEFDLGIGGDDSFKHVLTMREREDISRQAMIAEAMRRGILGPDYDPDADLSAILTDGADQTDPGFLAGSMTRGADALGRNGADALPQTGADAPEDQP